MNRRTGRQARLATCAALAGLVFCVPAQDLDRGTTTPRSLEAAGLRRNCFLHVPASLPADKPAALVLVFHGSGDTGRGIESLTRFSALADREQFLVAYPDAIGKNWNDGREVTGISSQFNNVDDVAFADALIRDIRSTHRVDPRRIFAAGFSNGGIFVHLLAARLGKQLAAAAVVSGGIAEPLAPKLAPVAPVSLFLMHGTKDPFVPYPGGNVDYSSNGRIITTADTVARWLTTNAADRNPKTGELPDRVATDNCRVKWSVWSSSKTGAELQLYTMEGAGHTWAGGPQFLPVDVIGEVCRDFDATEAIWDFFKKHPKP